MLLAHEGIRGPWAWQPYPDVWLAMALVIGAYVWAVRRRGVAAVTRKQATWFGLGWAAMWVVSDWPIHGLSEDYLLSVHMFQHLVYTLVVPPLLLLGTPRWMAEALLSGRRLAVVRRLARPLPAGVIFNVVLVLSHWPMVVDASLRSAAVHFAVHLVLVLTGVLMWLPVVSPHPAIRPLSYPLRMVYLFLQSVVPTVPASFITFAEKPVYRFYTEVPRYWLDVIDDQQLAGAVMKVGGGALLWAVIAGVFFRWYAVEDGGVINDPSGPVLTWDEVQAAFDRTPAPEEPTHPTP